MIEKCDKIIFYEGGIVEHIGKNIAQIQREIKSLTDRPVTLITVTKTYDIEHINQAIENGATDIGENRVQEWMEKASYIQGRVKSHIIGHLQRNKVKYIIGIVDLIQSVDRLSLVQEIERQAAKKNVIQDILIQVNVAGEVQKGGISPENVWILLDQIEEMDHVRVKGLMNIALHTEDQTILHHDYSVMRHLFEQLKNKKYKNSCAEYLSMGMTHDYKIAIEEGANMVRIGTGIFGRRNYG